MRNEQVQRFLLAQTRLSAHYGPVSISWILALTILSVAPALLAKDGHGEHATSGLTSVPAYKSSPRTYYRYTPPSSTKPPASVWAPVKSSTSAVTTSAADAYRGVSKDSRMSKSVTTKVDQGVASAKSWARTVPTKK